MRGPTRLQRLDFQQISLGEVEPQGGNSPDVLGYFPDVWGKYVPYSKVWIFQVFVFCIPYRQSTGTFTKVVTPELWGTFTPR